MSALDAKNQFGQLLDAAQANPVQINKHGRAVAYVISKSEYERLQGAKESTLEESILKANQEEANDESYKKEILPWDNALSDGLKDE